MKLFRLLNILFLLVFLSGEFVFAAKGLSALPLQDGIPVSKAENLKLDEAMINEAYSKFALLRNSRGLLIMRDGQLVTEKYFHDSTDKTPITIWSVSKIIFAALVQIAIEKKYIKSVDQPILDFFPEILAKTKDPVKLKITINNLLTMSACFNAADNDIGIGYAITGAFSRTRALFKRKLKCEPGKEFLYSTENTTMLSDILTRATGMSTKSFAEKYLFKPLKIKVIGWEQSGAGIYKSDLIFLKSRDLIKLGLLFIDDGLYKNQRIFNKGWANLSFAPKIDGPPSIGQYGYGWYTFPNSDYHYAWGVGGQFIFVSPSKKLVVVMTALAGPKQNPRPALDIFEKLILPAAK